MYNKALAGIVSTAAYLCELSWTCGQHEMMLEYDTVHLSSLLHSDGGSFLQLPSRSPDYITE